MGDFWQRLHRTWHLQEKLFLHRMLHVVPQSLQKSLHVELACGPALAGRHLPTDLASENWQVRT